MRHLTAVALLLSCHGILASPIQARSRLSSAEDLKSGHSAARAEVERIWATQEPPLQELLCSVPANAGSVLKNYNIRQAPAVTASVPVIDSLRSAGVPVYSACQVYVSDAWRFIYVRNAKASSTAVLAAIRNQMCGRSCSSGQLRRVGHMSQLAPVWGEYFVFTVVRNPWLRALSAYTMFTTSFLKRMPAGTGPGRQQRAAPTALERCGLPFSQFAEDVYSMRRICAAESCCAYLPRRGFLPVFVDSHISDQSHCVFLPNGDPVVDYIGFSEDLEGSWAAIVARINARAGTDFAAPAPRNTNGRGTAEAGGVKHSCVNGTAVAAAEVVTAGTAYAIAQQFAHDVVYLGYGVPVSLGG